MVMKIFYKGTELCVSLRNKKIEMFGVNVGLMHGCVMSPWRFNLIYVWNYARSE